MSVLSTSSASGQYYLLCWFVARHDGYQLIWMGMTDADCRDLIDNLSAGQKIEHDRIF